MSGNEAQSGEEAGTNQQRFFLGAATLSKAKVVAEREAVAAF
jgi:hypothetical protein